MYKVQSVVQNTKNKNAS